MLEHSPTLLNHRVSYNKLWLNPGAPIASLMESEHFAVSLVLAARVHGESFAIHAWHGPRIALVSDVVTTAREAYHAARRISLLQSQDEDRALRTPGLHQLLPTDAVACHAVITRHDANGRELSDPEWIMSVASCADVLKDGAK